MVQHPRILKLSNQPKFFGFFVRDLGPSSVFQDLGRPAGCDLNFLVNVLFDIHRLDVFQGFKFVIHAGKTGRGWSRTLAVPSRMPANGTRLTVGVQNVTPGGAGHRQRSTPLLSDLIGLKLKLFHLQIVGHNQSQSAVMCSTSACVSIQTRAPQWSGVCEWIISQGP